MSYNKDFNSTFKNKLAPMLIEAGGYITELEAQVQILQRENDRLKLIGSKSIEQLSNDVSNVTIPPTEGEFTMWSLGYCSHRAVLIKLFIPANAKRVYMGADAWWSIRVSEAIVKGYYSTKRLDIPEEINVDETPHSSGIGRSVFKYPMNEIVKPYYEFKEEGKMQDGACIPGWIRFVDAMWYARL